MNPNITQTIQERVAQLAEGGTAWRAAYREGARFDFSKADLPKATTISEGLYFATEEAELATGISGPVRAVLGDNERARSVGAYREGLLTAIYAEMARRLKEEKAEVLVP